MSYINTTTDFIREASRAGTEADFSTLDKLEYIANDWLVAEDERDALLSLVEMARLCADSMEEYS